MPRIDPRGSLRRKGCMGMTQKALLHFRNIKKCFASNVVLNGVDFSIGAGEIVALVGENGAGKSTLMNILFGMGVIHDTGGFEGTIEFDGTETRVESPQQAMALGIGMVHQEFMLLPGFSVARNIKLNRENLSPTILSEVAGKKYSLLDTETIVAEASASLATLGIEIDPLVTVDRLAVGHMQFVEIAREFNKDNLKLLVLDEPTAVLTETEADRFLACIKKMAESGIAVIFISHRLDEVMRLANRVVILRDGQLVFDAPVASTSKMQIAELMVGRKLSADGFANANRKFNDDDIILSIDHLRVDMPGERTKDVCLKVRRGEILGIGGLAGHGKASISNAIFGMYPADGLVTYEGKPLEFWKEGAALGEGMAFVSEDRKGVGLLLDESILFNATFTDMLVHRSFLRGFGLFSLFDAASAAAKVREVVKELDIRCTSSSQRVGSLSGGNQQKVCMARALITKPKVLFVSEPTRGIDIGAKQILLAHLAKINRENGITIIMTSSELNELRTICDRIAIVTAGVVENILRPDAPNVDFALAMSGERGSL